MQLRYFFPLLLAVSICDNAVGQTKPASAVSDKAQGMFDSGFQKAEKTEDDELKQYANHIQDYCLGDSKNSDVLTSFREFIDLGDERIQGRREKVEFSGAQSDEIVEQKLLLKLEKKLELLQRSKVKTADDVCKLRLEIEDIVDTLETLEESDKKKGGH